MYTSSRGILVWYSRVHSSLSKGSTMTDQKSNAAKLQSRYIYT